MQDKGVQNLCLVGQGHECGGFKEEIREPGEAVTAAMFQAMRDALSEQKQNPLSIDDVTAMIAGQIGQLAPMDKESVEMFQQFAKKMIEQAGTK